MYFSNTKLSSVVVVILVLLLFFKSAIKTTFIIATLPITWHIRSSDFYISEARDNFDLSFNNYSIDQQSSLPEYEDQVPAILHHIVLGGDIKEGWIQARNDCLQHHPDWETYLWTSENATQFVEEKFPLLKDSWHRYKYPIQRVDALRYMLLYEYGGAVLDMDLDCRRSLGPLRRFAFVAPAAHPVGFSNGFMMAARRHPFVGSLIRHLRRYDRNWFGLPYATVMFSTGCHYASSIHTIMKNRKDLKILSGPKGNENMHMLNGDVQTPLFHHLGASSWHSYDAALIMSIGRLKSPIGRVGFGVILGLVVLGVSVWASILRLRLWRKRRLASIQLRSESPTRVVVIPNFKRA